MTTFNYEIISETENAIHANVPYWEETDIHTRKHKQHFFKCWIPKSILGDINKVYNLVSQKMESIRTSNFYQKKFVKAPKKYKTIGEYAPIKEKCTEIILDLAKLDQLRKDFMEKHNASTINRNFLINEQSDDGVEYSEEVIQEARILYWPERYPGNPLLPMKKNIYYK